MNTYKITFAWTYGDLNETIKANTAQEAKRIFLQKTRAEYSTQALAAACFKVLKVEEIG